jgi:hypothetical protein
MEDRLNFAHRRLSAKSSIVAGCGFTLDAFGTNSDLNRFFTED